MISLVAKASSDSSAAILDRETSDLTLMCVVGERERLRMVHRKHHSGRTARPSERPCDDGKLSDAIGAASGVCRK